MPGLDGIEATRRIVRDSPRSRVLILTTFDLDEYAFAGLKAGAAGSLPKNTRPQELLNAIPGRGGRRGGAVAARHPPRTGKVRAADDAGTRRAGRTAGTADRSIAARPHMQRRVVGTT
ncbi:response regulator [Nonomuraea pusilla]|uniref:response regulator n=1 Tax=Nonomuraea pusilla TaxID=46177 RepID=UPI00210D5535|nr:response regulator transcription factor [Nonomuraea pusilla]